jgi:hypothetical protein
VHNGKIVRGAASVGGGFVLAMDGVKLLRHRIFMWPTGSGQPTGHFSQKNCAN